MKKFLIPILIVLLIVAGVMYIPDMIPTSSEVLTTPTPTQEEPHSLIIEDLAYIRIFVGRYTDDADPEYEGNEILIRWYDSKSEHIFFKDIPVVVSMEIVAINVHPLGNVITNKCVYKQDMEIDSAVSRIRIPFEYIKANLDRNYRYGRLRMIVHTPKQGDFSAEDDMVSLY